MLQEFKTFLLRGNVVDLAVGLVIGVAFGTVVSSFVENLLTPLISVPGEANFSRYRFTLGGGTFRYGVFANDVIAFVILAVAVFFFVVRPVNALMERFKTEPEPVTPTKTCSECLSSIPQQARRCAFCASPQEAQA